MISAMPGQHAQRWVCVLAPALLGACTSIADPLASGETGELASCDPTVEGFVDSMVHQARAQYGGSGGFLEILDLEVDGTRVFACTGTQGLMAWDASAAGAPTLMFEREGGPFANGSFPRCQHLGVDFERGRLVITSRGDEVQPVPFLYLFDVSDPSDPVALRGWSGEARSIEGVALDLEHSRIFAATHDHGITVFADDGEALRLATSYEDDESDAWQPLLIGDYLYVAEGRTGLRTYDVSGDEPQLLHTLALSGSAKDLIVRDTHLYVASSSHLAVVKLEDPKAPSLVSETATVGTALALAQGADDTLVVAEWDELRNYDISDPRAPHLLDSERVPTTGAFSRVLTVASGPFVGDALDDGSGDAGDPRRVYAGEWEGMHAYAQRACVSGPDIDLTPENLQFGQVEPGATRSAVLVIRNQGDQVLEVDEITLNPSARFSTSDTRVQVPPRDAVAIEISFTAADELPADGTVNLRTNDVDEPSRFVDLSANLSGVDVGDPAPTIDLVDLDGQTWTNASLEGKVTLLAYFATF